VIHLEGAIFDITDRKLAERRLKKAEWQHRMLVEGLPLVTYLLGLDGLMTYIAPQVELMLGYSADEIVESSGSLLTERLHPARDGLRRGCPRIQRNAARRSRLHGQPGPHPATAHDRRRSFRPAGEDDRRT
jgi:PAS domain-containing protein